MKKILFALMVFVGVYAFSSEAFSATTHNYVCADFNYISEEAVCNNGILTMPSGGSYATNYLSEPLFNLMQGTWYISLNYSGSGQARVVCNSYGDPNEGQFCISSPNSPNFTGSLSDHVLYTGAEPEGPVALYFRNDSNEGSFTLSNICISDTIGGCGSNSPIPPTPVGNNITGSGSLNRLAKFTGSQTIASSLLSDDGSNITLTTGNFFLPVGAFLDTVSDGVLNIGATNATSITIGRSDTSTIIPALSVGKQNTSVNCSAKTSPATCGSAPSGSVVISPNGTLTVNTTAITANSQILVTEDSSLDSRLGVKCNTDTGRTYSISGRIPGQSFTVKSSTFPRQNPACLNYWIIN